MATDLIIGVIGALGGAAIASTTSILTLRSTHKAERVRWFADRSWEHAIDVAHARREAFARFLACQNAMIMSAADIRNRQASRPAAEHMPEAQVPAYQALQDAYANALLLADPTTQALLIECQDYLDNLVWASWNGKGYEPRDGMQSELLAAMQHDAVDPPPLQSTVS